MEKVQKQRVKKETESVVIENKEWVDVPDIPIIGIKKEEITNKIVGNIVEDTDEILFLRSILDYQREGGWGRHLDEKINNRIKQLKNIQYY